MMPRERASAQISFTGKIAPLPEIMCEMAMTRVRGPMDRLTISNIGRRRLDGLRDDHLSHHAAAPLHGVEPWALSARVFLICDENFGIGRQIETAGDVAHGSRCCSQ